MLRLRLLAPLAVPFLLSTCAAPSPQPDGALAGGDGPQIEWQRSLDDALALAAAEKRPLLLAVNMDGESASDRIVRENYRDPAFVAATRRCVCVVASVFRHNPRDHDDAGRRIPCPRLGCVTCGEHMAMEPRLFEKLLADGDRVAPRHALVLPDGRKLWDLSLNFDLHDIDRALRAATKDVEERASGASQAAPWVELAARRDHAGRSALEARIVVASSDDATQEALAAIASRGDAGSLDALLLVGAGRLSPQVRPALVAAAKARGLAAALAAFCRAPFLERLPILGSWDLRRQADARLLLLAELDGQGAATRTLLLAHCAMNDHGALQALRQSLAPAAMSEVEAALRATGRPFRLEDALAAAPAVAEQASNGDAMPEAAEIERTLTELDAVPAANRDAAWSARFAKASLDLGRRHIDEGKKDAQLLLEDAEANWKKVLAADPTHADWWIERARTAYFLGRFADQIAHAHRAFAAITGDKPDLAQPLGAVAIEALRWIGDGHARLLGERANGDAAVELRGIAEGVRALARVAASAFGAAKDWLSLASFCGALGLHATELYVASLAAMRYPADRDLRQYLIGAFWNIGLHEEVPSFAERIAETHPDSADARWHAGYAHMLLAEHSRRTERPDEALASYAKAMDHFAPAMALRADYADNCRLWIALSWLGRGLAHVQVGHRLPAADCLVEAVKQHADLAGARDGLGYDVLDLVDKTFEWRDAGPSDADPQQLLERLLAAAPATPFYALAIADSQLREALRADGRNPERVQRDTVDAGGKPIRMAMGRATDEGDRYLRASLAAARHVLPMLSTDADKRVLAQADTIWAERMLERDRLDDVHVTLTEAATLLGRSPPPAGADAAALRAFAATLRAQLGPARPRDREGR